jgi:hypothetical protein
MKHFAPSTTLAVIAARLLCGQAAVPISYTDCPTTVAYGGTTYSLNGAPGTTTVTIPSLTWTGQDVSGNTGASFWYDNLKTSPTTYNATLSDSYVIPEAMTSGTFNNSVGAFSNAAKYEHGQPWGVNNITGLDWINTILSTSSPYYNSSAAAYETSCTPGITCSACQASSVSPTECYNLYPAYDPASFIQSNWFSSAAGFQWTGSFQGEPASTSSCSYSDPSTKCNGITEAAYFGQEESYLGGYEYGFYFQPFHITGVDASQTPVFYWTNNANCDSQGSSICATTDDGMTYQDFVSNGCYLNGLTPTTTYTYTAQIVNITGLYYVFYVSAGGSAWLIDPNASSFSPTSNILSSGNLPSSTQGFLTVGITRYDPNNYGQFNPSGGTPTIFVSSIKTGN